MPADRVAGVSAGDLDAEQVRIIDRVARRASESHTLVAIDEQVVQAAQTRSPKQLSSWLLRLIVRLEPTAFERRHRRALAERRVTVFQGSDGMGYVTGEVSAADAAAIDATLCAAARSLGKDDPRSQEQRRSDLFADLLLSRLCLEVSHSDGNAEWLEMDIDPDTGELLATQWRRVNADGEPIEESPDAEPDAHGAGAVRTQARAGSRIGVVVPLTSLLDLDDTPAELADRSASIPAEDLRQLISDTLGPNRTGHDEVRTRSATDPGGRLPHGPSPAARLARLSEANMVGLPRAGSHLQRPGAIARCELCRPAPSRRWISVGAQHREHTQLASIQDDDAADRLAPPVTPRHINRFSLSPARLSQTPLHSTSRDGDD